MLDYQCEDRAKSMIKEEMVKLDRRFNLHFTKKETRAVNDYRQIVRRYERCVRTGVWMTCNLMDTRDGSPSSCVYTALREIDRI